MPAEPLAVHTATPQFEDEASYFTPATAKDANRARFWRSFTNQSLLLVEVLAVAGLVFLGYTMITAVNRLQEETASAQALADEQRRLTIPTLEPTPQIRLSQVVLPGGHVFTETGEVRFNIEEIPEMFRSQVASELTQPVIFRPPPTRETALALDIPDLNLNQTIVPGVDWDALKLGIGQLQNDVNPGDPEGNLVLAGHNDIYGEYFRYLDQLEAGDEFFIRTETEIYTYRVTEWQIIEPTDVWVYNPRGGATATLISCWPYRQSDKRIAVFAERVD
jgi:sortase A